MARTDGNSPERDTDSPESSRDDRTEPQGEGRNLLERVVSLTSALLLVAVVGYLVWEGITHDEPPSFDVRAERIWEADGRYHVLISVENTGSESVQSLSLDVHLQQADSTVTTVTGNLSWLPARSRRRTAVVFSKDPRRYKLVFEPKGYELP